MECDKLDRGNGNGKSNGRVWSAQVVATQDLLWMYVDRKIKTHPSRIKRKRKIVLDVEEVDTLLLDAMPHAIKMARVLEKATKPETQTGQAPAQKPQRRTDGNPQQPDNNFSKLCYRYGAEAHLARNCTTAPTIPHAHIPDTKTAGNNARKDSLATYTMEVTRNQLCNPILPQAYSSSWLNWVLLDLGTMSIKCGHCNAFHWIAERVAASTRHNS